MVTIKDVAKEAGVSYSTVSRALSGSRLVDAGTREKVLAAAGKLHYVPNQMARGLKVGRSKTVMLIVPTMYNTFFSDIVMRYEDYFTRKGYAMLLGISDYSKQGERRCVENARAFQADGIILIPSTDDYMHIRSLVETAGMPVVLADQFWETNTVCVTIDNAGGAYTAVKYLIEKGHRRIACYIRDISLQHLRERYEGCISAFRDFGIPPEQTEICATKDLQATYDTTMRLLKTPNPPTAIFCSSDWLANGVYSAAAACGLSVPKDVSVVGFDDISSSKYMIPPLTTLDHPIDGIARVSVDKILEAIDRQGQSWGEKIVLPSRMIERQSVRDLTKD